MVQQPSKYHGVAAVPVKLLQTVSCTTSRDHNLYGLTPRYMRAGTRGYEWKSTFQLISYRSDASDDCYELSIVQLHLGVICLLDKMSRPYCAAIFFCLRIQQVFHSCKCFRLSWRGGRRIRVLSDRSKSSLTFRCIIHTLATAFTLFESLSLF